MSRELLGIRPPPPARALRDDAAGTCPADRVRVGALALAPAPCGGDCAACRLGLDDDPGGPSSAGPSAEPVPQQERVP